MTYQKGGVSSSLSITVTQPRFGLYSSKEASAAAYLGSEIRIGSADDTFYIVAADGFENFKITEIHFEGTSGSHDASDDFDITYSSDGTYAALSPKADALPMGGDYTVILLNNGAIEFVLIRTDIPALTTPSGISGSGTGKTGNLEKYGIYVCPDFCIVQSFMARWPGNNRNDRCGNCSINEQCK